ncbi:MAG: PilN domain-containing protein [Deltaproteobacteria bacterium]|nr:PilN domain-containing protein [Deltaproteobacteria bacterium]
MIRINLLPFRAARKKENIRRQVSYYFGSVILAVVVMIYLFVGVRGDLKSLKQKKQSKEAELATFEETIKRIDELEKKIAEMRKKLDVIKDLEKKKTGPVHLLDQVADAIPRDKLFLTSFVEKDGKLTLTGTAMDNETFSVFMTRLAEAELITSVDMKETKARSIPEYKLNVFDFSLECITYAHKEPEPEVKTVKKK